MSYMPKCVVETFHGRMTDEEWADWCIANNNIEEPDACQDYQASSHELTTLPQQDDESFPTAWLSGNPLKTPALLPENDYGTEQEWFDHFNTCLAAVIHGGKVFIIYAQYQPSLERDVLTFSTAQQLRSFFCNKTILVNKKPIEVFDIWYRHPQRTSYTGIDFAPGHTLPPTIYNLWGGFNVQPRSGDCSLFKQHILEVIADGNQQIYTYLLDFLADLFQLKPKSGVAVVLIGAKRTGKGIFVNALGHLLGRHFVYLNSSRQLVGNFNAHLQNALLVFADEAVWGGNREAESILKSMITEPFQLIEPKNVDPFQIKNYARLMVASNNAWVVPASRDEERYLVLEVSDKKKGDHAYFKAIMTELESGGYEALLYELLHRDISQVNLREVPQTQAFSNQVLQTDLMPAFLIDCINNQSLYEVDGVAQPWGNGRVPSKALQQHYQQFVKNQGRTDFLSPIQFNKKLLEWLTDDQNTVGVKHGRIYVDYHDGSRSQLSSYHFEAIETLKAILKSKLHDNSQLWIEEEAIADDLPPTFSAD